MDVSAIVTVFPNVYSRRRVALLTSNVKSMLRARSLRFSSVKRDGNVIVVDAHDPVFASSAIGLLFGTERIEIARRTGTQMSELVEMISVTATSLLLKGERFIVRVKGKTVGYLPRDAEIAATSAIISASTTGARPGSESSHDRVIYAHVAKSYSYVSIFSDKGRGGIPFGSHKDRIVCPIHDELSALATLETLRQGNDILPVVVYSTDAARTRLAKLVCKIVSSIPRAQTDVEFVRVSTARGAALNIASLKAAISTAKSSHLKRICIPSSPLIHDVAFSDSLTSLVRSASMIPTVPLAGVESRLSSYGTAMGIETITDHLERFVIRTTSAVRSTREICRTRLELRVSPNMLHDTLDSLSEEC